MGIINDMDWVYDLKLLDDEDEIPSRYRNGAKNTGRYRTTRRLDNHYDPIITDLKLKTVCSLNQWKYDRYYKTTWLLAICDYSVGEILDYLKTNNLDENTIVIYTSDQGFIWCMDGLTNVYVRRIIENTNAY